MIGKTLSHFRVTVKLGEGGMDEVNQDEDTQLGRDSSSGEWIDDPTHPAPLLSGV